MRKEIKKLCPAWEIKCDICGKDIDKAHRATVRGKIDGQDIIYDFHNSCLVQLLSKLLEEKDLEDFQQASANDILKNI